MTKTGGESLFISDGKFILNSHFILLCVCVLVCGCSVAGKMDEINTLKSVAKSQEQLEEEVNTYNVSFHLMLEDYKQSALSSVKTQKQLLKLYGQPVGVWAIDEPPAVSKWLYRESTNFFKSDKLYVYFDENQNIVNIIHHPSS